LAQQNAVTSQRISVKTRYAYNRANSRFFAWLRNRTQNDPTYYDENGSVNPYALDLPIFQQYIVERQSEDSLSFAALSTERSAFIFFLKEHGVRMSEEAKDLLCAFFSGAHRIDANMRQTGERMESGGKRPLPFHVFSRIARKLLTSTSRDRVRGHAYHVWLWATMARNNNVASMLASHISVDNDALCVRFEITKCDQIAERSPTIFVYANPLQPEICPVLALALHWLLFPCGVDGQRVTVFGCEEASTRFYSVLSSVLNDADTAHLLAEEGMDTKGIATHSYRKGGATYCCTGVSQPPPAASVYRRAGWGFGDVGGRYIFFDPVGDRIVGRTLTGLPPEHPEFMTLPPHFLPDAPELPSIRC